MTRRDIACACLISLVLKLTSAHSFQAVNTPPASLGPVLLHDSYNNITNWNETTEDLVRLYLDAKKMI